LQDIHLSAAQRLAISGTIVVATLLAWSALIPGLIRRRREAWAIYLALYFAMLLQAVPPGAQIFVPVFPLILLAMWEGCQSMRPSPRLVQVTATIACVIVGMLAVAGGYVRLTNAHVKPSLQRYD
jgi:hypothetical protein